MFSTELSFPFSPVSIDINSKLSMMLETGKNKRLLKIFSSSKKQATNSNPFGITAQHTLLRTHKFAEKYPQFLETIYKICI